MRHAGGAGLQLERIRTLAAFEAARADWEAIEREDPQATVFMRWRWLRAYLPVARHRWTILALRESARAVAFLPIAWNGSLLDRELFLGGNPVADYAGMLALPRFEEAAIAAFADALIGAGWDGLNLLDVSDPRIATLVRRLVDRGAQLETTEESRCLSCALPDSWDAYVSGYISAKTRVNVVRVERRLAEALPGFRISEPNAEDIDAHVAAMIAVNHSRWGGNLRNAHRRYGRLFRNAFDTGVLRMVIYWDADRPIAGAAAFVDDERSYFGLYMIGFDQAYSKLSPGKGIVGRAIRTAIESGYRHFDFMRGDEEYKARYARDVHTLRQYRLTRPGLRACAIAFARPKWFALKLAIANVVYGPGRTL
ncbi:MAG: GNAT family N-acetyltransferase [Candidatus Eremiobacteraeota bacterium]|nr:GNAT family N-acetyltransferase [Candidatus Eremiobacteraeota bacterium]